MTKIYTFCERDGQSPFLSLFHKLDRKLQQKILKGLRCIANNTVNLSEIMTTASDGEGVLGKIVFYGLGGIMIDREEFERLRAACQVSAPTNFRSTPADAFRSATGDLHDRLVRGTQIYKVYCRDNRQRRHTISRELILEAVDSTTNLYTKLANIVLDKDSEIITLEDAAYNPIADALPYFDQVQESFQLYRRCVNRRQMDTVLGKMLDDMEAVKVQSRGGMYFVPRQHMAKIDIFEDFLETMNEHALSENQVDVNSMYVVDNERQREKMAHEFYVALKKEIETYQERASHLINTGCESPTIMARWVSKIRELGEKRRRYEALFQRQISEVDGEFNTLQGFARELQVRIDHAHLKPLRSCA